MSSPAPASRLPRGFTLIELLVVLVVLAVMATMVGLSDSASDEQALNQAELYVRDSVRRAKELAIGSRTPHGVAFDLAAERLIIVNEDGVLALDPQTKRGFVVELNGPNHPRHIEIDSAAFGAAGAALLFDGQGVPLTDGSVTLRSRDVTRTLVLNRGTGLLN